MNAINRDTSLTCHDTLHDNGLQSWLQSSTTISVNAHEMWKGHNQCMRVLQSNTRDVVKGHNGLQQCACSNTVCQRHSMHRPFKHYKYSAFHISTPFRTIIAVQWMSLAHKYSGARGDFANRCELFDVSTIQTLQL